jgi:hypothetical protein
VRVAVAVIAVLLAGSGMLVSRTVTAATATPAIRDHIATLKRIQRQMLLGEIDRPDPGSDTWIEPRIVSFPPGVRPLPDPAGLDEVTLPSTIAFAPPNRRPSDPHEDQSPGSTQSEASVATWHGLMLAAWNDGELLGNRTGVIGWGVSIDGGRTWVDGGGPPVGGAVVSWSSDPVVAVDEHTGWFYLSALAIGTGPSNAIAIVRGRFLGATLVWDTPQVIRTVRDTVLDKPWIAVDSGTGAVHVTYTTFYGYGQLALDRIDHQVSVDGGISWSPPFELSLDSERGLVQGSRVAVIDQDHLVALYRALDPDPDAGGIDHLRVRLSTDGGASFAPPLDVTTAYTNYSTGAPGFDRGFAPNFASLAVDHSAGPHRGRIYVAWNESLGYYDDPLGTAGLAREVEPNASHEEATPFAIGATVQGAIDPIGDVDRFRFTGEAGRTVIVLLDSLSDTGPLTLRLEQGGTGASLALSQPIPVRARLIVFTLPETGEYQLTVASTQKPGAYELQTGWAARGSERGRDHRDVFVAWSDNGSDWSVPVRVNHDAPRFENWMPEVAVDGEGRVFAAWLDWRDSEPGAVPSSHLYLGRSLDGGVTWKDLGPASTAPTSWGNVSTNLVPNQGDYIGLVADSANVMPIWGDGRSGTPDIFLALWPVTLEVERFAVGEIRADSSSVRIEWRAQSEGLAGRIERSLDRGPWTELGVQRSDRGRRIVTDDTDLVPGTFARYRLQVEDENGFETAASTEALLPGGGGPRLGLTRAGGLTGSLVVNFRLGSGAGGEIELLDLGGRRLVSRTVQGGMDSGGTIELAASGALRPGVYFVRLRQAGESRTLKAVVLR